MLSNIDQEICNCPDHAEDCVRKAATQSNLQLRNDFILTTPLASTCAQHGAF